MPITNKVDSTFKFAVAFSFPGEYRDRVQEIDKALARWINPNKVFLDERFEALIAGFNADKVLQDIYPS